MKIDEKCRYSKEHEWAREDGEGVVVGISDYAQVELGDIVFVDLPEVGTAVKAGDSVATVESVKAVSDIYSPIDGEVVKVNEELSDAANLVNESPFESGWIVALKPSDKGQLEELMDAASYQKYLDEISK